MRHSLEILLTELERFGEDNDRAVAEHPQRMLNITRDTGEFLSVLIRATGARRVLEIGTSNGYSTLWLASAVGPTGGLVTTVERSEAKVLLARQTFSRSGLADRIRLVHEDAARALAQAAEASMDFVFLDSDRFSYPAWWPQLRRVLRPGGLLVADNATSHPEQLAPFVNLVKHDAEFTSTLVPVGKGEFLAVKSTH